MRNDFESNYLMHHGILGQKWGKRNGPPYPLNQSQKSKAEKKREDSKGSKTQETSQQKKKHLTDEQKRKLIRNGAIAAGVALAVVGGVYLYKKKALHPLNVGYIRFGYDVDLSKLSSKSKTISKNTKLQRISSTSVDDYVKNGKSFYASYLKKDNAIYKEIMPSQIESWYDRGITHNKEAFVNSMKLKRDIKIASERDVAEAYMKVIGSNHVDEGKFTKFIENLVERDSDVNKAFIKELKSKGFDGIIDTNDAKETFTKSPLFLFDASDIIASTKTRKLGKIERFINVITS